MPHLRGLFYQCASILILTHIFRLFCIKNLPFLLMFRMEARAQLELNVVSFQLESAKDPATVLSATLQGKDE